MSKEYIKNVDANNVDDINKVIANCGVHITMPSDLIPVFKEHFPDAKINWGVGCKVFYINGIAYEHTLGQYTSGVKPHFYKSIIYNR